MSLERVNVALFDEPWSPKVVGELNGQHVIVVKGRFRMEFRDRSVWIEEGSSSSWGAASSTAPSPRRRLT